jgi:uncharacterized protein (TIGR02466 family)
MKEVFTLWSSFIWAYEIDNFDDENINLKKFIYSLKNNKSVTKSNRGGWQSDNLTNYKEMDKLKNSISSYTHEIFSGINKAHIKPLDIPQIWANINHNNCFNDIHQHGMYTLSGTYYLEVPENSGNIVFRDPRSGALSSSNYHAIFEIGEFFEFVPRKNLLLLFPSFLDHFVRPNMSNEERISVSFDLI